MGRKKIETLSKDSKAYNTIGAYYQPDFMLKPVCLEELSI